MANNPFAEFAAPQENPFTQFAVASQPTEMPAPRQPTSSLTQFGRSAASLADVTLGGLIPGAAQYVMPPILRAAGRSPEQATASTQALVGAVDRPFGKTFGVAETPEYQQEVSRQVMDFIGQNFQKGAKFISDKTGFPVSDVENMMASLTIAAPKIAPPVVRAVREVTAPVVQQVRTGAQLPFEPMLQARRERLSAESYAKGPQLDAAAEAQRLKLAIIPTDIENSISGRLYSTAAGPRGPEALATANRPRVNEIAKNELGLDLSTPLTSATPFKQARNNLAAPYDEVRNLPTLTADETTIANLNGLRKNEKIIGGEGVAKKVGKLVDDAIAKTQAGLTGAELLENVRTLRADAKKIYNSQSATPKQLSVADANLAIANQLESMIDSNISNPKLLGEWRDARQKMARTYAYESATNFNTGFVDASKLARLTSKDNALTGDIASIGRIAGNNPEAFTAQPSSKFFSVPRISRSGLLGGLGYLAGSPFGLTGSIIGGLAGGALGEFGGAAAANRLASPGYQAGLKLQDFRIPTNQLAASMQPIPQNRAVVPYQAPVEVLQQGEGTYFPDFVLRPGEQGPLTTPGVAPGPAQIGMAQGPVGGQMGALRMEDARIRNLSMQQGAQAEAQAAAAAAAGRQSTGRGSVLEFDPITGTYKVGGEGVRGATPEIFMSDTGRSLNTATQKIASRQNFALSAEERVAWEKTKVDLAAAVPELKGLSDKAIAGKIMDREWASNAVAKARQQAQAFDEIAQRGATDLARRAAAKQRDLLVDALTTLEEQLRPARPVSSGRQGPKTIEALRKVNKLGPDNQNAMTQ